MVLAQDTDFILLDEPLNNLDIQRQHDADPSATGGELGETIIIVLHELNMASQYADEIAAFIPGRSCRERLLKSCRLT